MPLRASSHPGSPNSPSCSALAWYSCWPGLSPWGESGDRTPAARTAALTRYRYTTQPTHVMWQILNIQGRHIQKHYVVWMLLITEAVTYTVGMPIKSVPQLLQFCVKTSKKCHSPFFYLTQNKNMTIFYFKLKEQFNNYVAIVVDYPCSYQKRLYITLSS